MCIFNNKKVKTAGLIISILIIIGATALTFANRTTYNTTILVNGGETGAVFDNSYKAYLEDSKYGDVHIEYSDGLEDYLITAEFKRAGKTNLILEDSAGNKTVFELEIKNNSYEINKKK